MTDCKLDVAALTALEPPPVAYSTLSSRNSSQESLALSTTLSTRKLTALPFTLKTHASNDQVRTRCKQLIMDYKVLQTQLQKFTHRSGQLSRTNQLRLTLLRFLRLKSELFMKDGAYAKEMLPFVIKTANYGAKVLTQWWTTLLQELNLSTTSGTGPSKLSNVDRSVYLECISRIMARKEWDFVKRSSETFSELLILTSEYCFHKLIPMKTTPLSINAFIGKTFAYSFMEVHNFAPLLLFTLFVKNYTILKILHILPPKLSSSHPILKEDQFDTALPTLLKLMDFEGDFGHLLRQQDFPQNLFGATCMYPPKITSFDDLEINLKDNIWVKKWASFDSDVFCSFLKHYYTLCFENYNISSHSDLLHCPGYIIIYGHIKEMLDSTVGHIKKFKVQTYKDQTSGSTETMIIASYSSQNGTRQDFTKFISNLPIMPIFKVIRSIMYESDDRIGQSIVKSIESLILSKAHKVHAYDSQTCEAIYDVFTEFLIHLQHDTQKFSRQLDWHFWISGLINMIQTGHMVCQVKSLCFLFNIWNMLPIDFVVKALGEDQDLNDTIWINDADFTLIYNLSTYLIGKPVWEELFGHWSPLVRHYYNRLVVFKVVGTSNDNYGSYLTFRKTLKLRLNSSYDLFRESVGNDDLSLIRLLDMQPSNPIVNKKLIITPMDQLALSSSCVNVLDSVPLSISYQNMSASSSTSTLLLQQTRKMYAYDIFDDAIYSSSTGYSSDPTLPRSFSRSSTSSPTMSSASLKRTSSSSALARVPIIGSALSFFKKVNGSQPNSPVPTTQSPLPKTPIPENSYEDLKFLSPSPYLGSNNNSTSGISQAGSRSPSFIKKSPSMLSSPSSSISEISDDDPDAFLSLPKSHHNLRSPGSATSRVSSVSSVTSLASLSSMDALPTPPELLNKVPDLKRFRYKFHLAFSNDLGQLQNRITKCKKPKFFNDLPSSPMPSRPTLPFEKTSMGLLNNESYADFGGSPYEEELEDCEDEDSDGYDEYLMIPRSKQQWTDTREIVEFKDLKNHVLLGRFLNEWKLVVEEYEKFMSYTNEFVSSDENSFVDPMLVADIPPIKVK